MSTKVSLPAMAASITCVAGDACQNAMIIRNKNGILEEEVFGEEKAYMYGIQAVCIEAFATFFGLIQSEEYNN